MFTLAHLFPYTVFALLSHFILSCQKMVLNVSSEELCLKSRSGDFSLSVTVGSWLLIKGQPFIFLLLMKRVGGDLRDYPTCPPHLQMWKWETHKGDVTYLRSCKWLSWKSFLISSILFFPLVHTSFWLLTVRFLLWDDSFYQVTQG